MKQNMRSFITALIFFICCFAQRANATEITFKFHGTIGFSNVAGVSVGDAYVATLSYDPLQSPSLSGSTAAFYVNFNFSIAVSGLTFSRQGTEWLSVENDNGYEDIFQCNAPNTSPHVGFMLRDLSSSGLSSTALPISLSLASLPDDPQVRWSTASSYFLGDITSITSCINNPIVTSNADAGPGSLRQAIIDACEGSIITFDPSLNGQTITLASTLPTIDKNLTITGPGANLLTISGNGLVRVFEINSASPVNISGLTIADGHDGVTGGGAIYSHGTATLNVNYCSFNNNKTTNERQGGAILCGNQLGVYGCTFSGNMILGNAPASGGAIYMSSVALCNVSNSTFTGNMARTSGAAISAYNASIVNCTITGNSLTQNDYHAYGGGVHLYTGIVYNSIVAGNIIGPNGPESPDLFTSTASVFNSIIGVYDGNGSALVNGVNDNQVGTIANPINPLLGPLADNGGSTQTMALLQGSPAIDAGANSGATPTDQRGFARVGTVDIGAFEVQTFPTNTSITSDINPSCIGTAVTFTATVTSNGNPVTEGTVSFTEGNTTLAANVSLNNTGQAGFTTNSLSASAHNITATYNAAGIFETSNQSITQTVDAPATPVITGTLGICNGGGTTLSTTAVANGSYCWNSSSAAPAWGYVGSPGFSASTANYTSLAIAGNTPYVAYQDAAAGYRTTVMKFDGSNWVNTGIPGFSGGAAAYQNLAVDGSTPYVAYTDNANGNRITVMKFDGVNWAGVGNPGFSAGAAKDPSLAFSGGIPYVAYTDAAYGSKTVVRKFDGVNWIDVGSPGFSGGYSQYQKLAFSGGTPYVAFQDEGAIVVMKFDGTDWVSVGSGTVSTGTADYPSLALDGSTPYVAYRDFVNSSKTTVMKFDGTNWISVGVPGFSAGQGIFQSLAFSGSTPYVAYRDVVYSDRTTVMKFDGTNWVNVGNPGFSAGTSNGQNLAFLGNVPFVAYMDIANNVKVSVMKFDIPSCIGSNNSLQVNTEGAYTVTVTNENGCSATSAPAIVTINPVPDVTATPLSQTICSGNSITTIAFLGSVSGTSYNWTRDNGDFASGTITGIPANGTGNINGTLINTTGTDVTVSFTITPTANGCTGVPVVATVTVRGKITINPPTVTQPSCTVSTGQIVVNATAGAALEYSINGGTNWSSSNIFSSLVPGTYNISVRLQANPTCVVNYGNAVILVAATNCCTIVCPANMIVNNKSGSCGAYVTYPAATKVGSCGTAPLVYSKPCGAWFPIGVTIVTVSSSTGASCFFTITVKDVQKPVISCPSNISTTTTTCSKVVNFSVTATDNCPGVTATASPASGTAFPAGTTTVTIIARDASNNTSTSTFTVTVKESVKPVISCPANITVNAQSGQCYATVNTGTATATDNCNVVTITGTRSDSKALTATYPVGITTITWKATDRSGNYVTCQQKITVKDMQSPVISGVSANPSTLWPADHSMKTVTINYTSTDNCMLDCSANCVLSVTSNEPTSGLGGGDIANDWQVISNHSVKLRSERKNSGTGRIYTIKITCTDANGNLSTQTVTVKVPINAPGSSKGGDGIASATGTQANGKAVDENSADAYTFQVSPNPTAYQFNLLVKSNINEKVSITIFDMTGRIVKQIKTAKGNIRFGDDLVAGTYLVEVRHGDEKQVIKVIKL